MSKPVDNIKFAVIKENGLVGPMVKGFDECLQVLQETDRTIVVTGSKYGSGIRRIAKHRVAFYTDHDITDAIKNANDLINKSYHNHIQYVVRQRIILEADHGLDVKDESIVQL